MAMLDMVWLGAVFVISTAVVWLSLRQGWAWRLAVDVPNLRSLHSLPVPRVGGLLVMPWVLMGAALLTAKITLVCLAGFLVAISFLDDKFSLPVVIRFLAHLILAALAVVEIGVVGLFPFLLLTLAIAWMTNLYNFMDGSDGLAGGMAVIGFSAYATAALSTGDTLTAQFSLCVVGGMLAFLLFNFSPASVFLGDAGSISLGFLAGVLGLLGWQNGSWDIWFPLLVFSPFIVDATVTLLRRALRGERVWQAHREHSYQKLVQVGWSHRKTALAEYGLMAVMALLALALLRTKESVAMLVLVFVALMYALIIIAIDVKWRHSKPAAG
jgi:UDP-N-acetylmuramyl pentapeptide phosphotransferase/UDP-N-acetylglucosamine-1-phosphate transferase